LKVLYCGVLFSNDSVQIPWFFFTTLRHLYE
jgi:hypothetical protein